MCVMYSVATSFSAKYQETDFMWFKIGPEAERKSISNKSVRQIWQRGHPSTHPIPSPLSSPINGQKLPTTDFYHHLFDHLHHQTASYLHHLYLYLKDLLYHLRNHLYHVPPPPTHITSLLFDCGQFWRKTSFTNSTLFAMVHEQDNINLILPEALN